MDINGISAIVTGGGSGLGEATARALAAKGARVTIVDVQEDKARQVAADIGGLAVRADVTSEDDIRAAFKAAGEAHGVVRIVVNCAGVAPAVRVMSKKGVHALDVFQRTININLLGSFNVIRLCAEQLIEADLVGEERGVIINTASVAAYDGQIGQAAYAASKGGVVGMTLPIARDLMSEGIRCNTILPGIFNTPLLQGAPENVKAALSASVPFPKRLGNPEEYAQLAVTMITNGYFNGEDVRLDGAIRMAPR